jgi:hypothetical protein
MLSCFGDTTKYMGAFGYYKRQGEIWVWIPGLMHEGKNTSSSPL